MKRITRRQARSWLAPMRDCFAQMKTGEVDAIRGYAVTRLHHKDEYARIDSCIAGFRALIVRLCPEINPAPLERVEKKLAAGTPLTVQELDAALSLFKQSENALLRHSIAAVKSAVLAEQIVIELDSLGITDSTETPPTMKEKAA